MLQGSNETGTIPADRTLPKRTDKRVTATRRRVIIRYIYGIDQGYMARLCTFVVLVTCLRWVTNLRWQVGAESRKHEGSVILSPSAGAAASTLRTEHTVQQRWRRGLNRLRSCYELRYGAKGHSELERPR